MTKARQDLIGRKFGWLDVIEKAEERVTKGRRYTAWLCQCKCGTRAVMTGISLKDSVFRSCGCAKKLPEYSSWNHMITRCQNHNNPQFKNYGGRGITVCERWRSFGNFYADMGPRPGPKYSIDRIDNNGNYEPGNCRWATAKTQMRNMSRNVIVDYQGKKYTISGLAELHGMNPNILNARIKRGLSAEEAVAEHYVGKKASEETRAKISAARRRRDAAKRVAAVAMVVCFVWLPIVGGERKLSSVCAPGGEPVCVVE